MTRPRPWTLAVLFLAYFAAALGSIFILDKRASGPVETAAGVLLWPLAVVVRTAMPLLKRLGLAEGEWIVLPSVAGWAVISAAGTAVFYLLGVILFRKKAP